KKIFFIFYLTIFVVSAFSQNAVTLDTGISQCAREVQKDIPRGTKLVVLNIRSSFPQLSEYVLEELIDNFIRSGSFTVVDRSNLEMIRRELQFNLSGEVSDETAQSIGKMLGAQIIVSGSIDQVGDIFRLRLRAITVETAAFQAAASPVSIQRDRFVNSLTGSGTGGSPQSSGSSTPSHPPPSGSSGRTLLPDYLLN
ncbi:MAG: CsgG/HfaB family protein, partial [Treponema sp.]|nr:CsgG/HfaB family protein [Treponema sp.]